MPMTARRLRHAAAAALLTSVLGCGDEQPVDEPAPAGAAGKADEAEATSGTIAALRDFSDALVSVGSTLRASEGAIVAVTRAGSRPGR